MRVGIFCSIENRTPGTFGGEATLGCEGGCYYPSPAFVPRVSDVGERNHLFRCLALSGFCMAMTRVSPGFWSLRPFDCAALFVERPP